MTRMAVYIAVIVTLLISPNTIFVTSFFSDNLRSGYFQSIRGSALINHILSTQFVESSEICARLCLRDQRCLSFNFGTTPWRGTNFMCELSSSNAKRSPASLQKHSKFDFFQFLDICPPQAIRVLPYIDDQCNVDTSLIELKYLNSTTDITCTSVKGLRYAFNFSEAVQVCKILNGALATLEQMQAAWNEGYDECSYGWLADGSRVLPMQAYRLGCIGAGLNRRVIDKGKRYTAYCFAINP